MPDDPYRLDVGPDDDDWPPLAWSRCTVCASVTPFSWDRRAPGQGRRLVPVTVCCACCGTVYEISTETDLFYTADRIARHDQCGTVLSCPSAANVVRCSAFKTTVLAGTPCGAFFVGPAGGDLPRIVP